MTALQSKAGALSRTGDADMAFLRELAGMTQTQDAGVANGLLDEPQLVPRREDLLRAALRDGFEPLTLMPGITEVELQALLRHCTVTQQSGAAQWRLGAAARSDVLGEAARRQELKAAATDAWQAGNSGKPAPSFSRALLQLVLEGVPSESEIAAVGRDMWPAYQAAVAVLRDGGVVGEADASRLNNSVRLAELMEPLRFLIDLDPVGKTDSFIGREAELRALRKFVDVLASKSVLESFQRSFSRFTSDESRAMVMSGIGGVGKSTLVAKFLVDHTAKIVPATRLVFSYLDFDRAAISGAQPATLLLEILRQLAFQLDRAQSNLELLRQQVQHNLETVAAMPSFAGGDSGQDPARLPRELIDRSQMNLYLESLTQALADKHGDRVMLVVLDTFEEVQLLGDEATVRIEGFIEDLLRVLPNLRVLVVGRDEVSGFFQSASRLPPLKGFTDKLSRRAFLEARGVPSALSEQIATQAGGRPLALLLAARLVSEFDVQTLDLSWTERFKTKLDKALTEGILYERILQHIPDTQLRRIAHPGLVLRRLDADAIVQVLAPALGLGEISHEAAQKLLTLLRRQRDLVRVEPDGSVVHRADVRSQMLHLMRLRDSEAVKELHRAAIKYYRSRQLSAPGAQDRSQACIEEIYHLLCLGQDLNRVVALWSPAARLALGRSLEEISDPYGKLALRVLLNRTVGLTESKSLPPVLAQIYAENATRSALSQQFPERAIRILDTWMSALPEPKRSQLRAQALDRNGEWIQAKHCFLNAPPAEDAPEDYLLAWTDFFERTRLESGERAKYTTLVLPHLASLKQTITTISATQRILVRAKSISEFLALSKSLDKYLSSQQAQALANETLHPWLATIGMTEVRPGLQRFQDLGDSDLQRRQAKVLLQLCSDQTRDADRVIQRLCESLLSSDRRRSLALVEKELPWINESYQTVLRHLMRPSTPQWYVPFAVQLGAREGKVGWLEDVLDLTVAQQFGIKLPERVGSTRALADVLRELDQLGLLDTTLRRSSPHANSSAIGELLLAYKEWRADLMLIDQEFATRLQYWNLG